MCVSGESEPVSVTSLPHHGSDPISVHKAGRILDFCSELQVSLYLPLIKGDRVLLPSPVASVLYTLEAAGPTHLGVP